MTCASCGLRKGHRSCPALGELICSACCGAKRGRTIRCPSNCEYLAAAVTHPASNVRRQQERDLAVLAPTIRHLTERHRQLFFLFQTSILGHRPQGTRPLVDADVAEATRAAAKTLETAAKGVIYEQLPDSLPAQRLARELLTRLEDVRGQGARVFDAEAALVLRAIAAGAGDTRRSTGNTTSPRAYLDLIGRVLGAQEVPGGAGPDPSTGSIIIP